MTELHPTYMFLSLNTPKTPVSNETGVSQPQSAIGKLQTDFLNKDQLSDSYKTGIPTTQSTILIRHANEYPTMHYLGIPRHPQSMNACKILTEYL